MRLLTAISAKIEPYSVSDEALELGLLESCDHLGVTATTETEYSAGEHSKVVALAAMKALSGLRTLSTENVGGISQSYNTAQIDKLIRSIARQAGLNPSLVGVDSVGESVVRAVNVW